MNSINELCKQYNIKNYTINPDGSIDVNGNVDLSGCDLTELPLTFNIVLGFFEMDSNNLTSLKGSPWWVGDYFSCNSNYLTGLEFSPEYVGGGFYCEWNRLTNNYCETEIIGYFYTTLKQDGMILDYNKATNYNEWRKLYKRKQTLNELYKRTM